MSDDAKILVRYVRNADETRATGSIKFHDDDREDLVLGEIGRVTTEELHLAAARGVVLEPITKAEAKKLGLEIPSEEPAAASAPAAASSSSTSTSSGGPAS